MKSLSIAGGASAGKIRGKRVPYRQRRDKPNDGEIHSRDAASYFTGA
jgi:hypothetical protein